MKKILAISLILFVVGSLLVIPAGALSGDISKPGSQGQLAENSPEILSALKAHSLSMGESQEARMNGVIRYIDCIGQGSVIEELGWIQEDYLTAAASIPLMKTSAEINSARQDMQVNSVLFSDETANRLVRLGGNAGSMKDYINDSEQLFEAASANKSAHHWLESGNARLIIFDKSAGNRNLTLADLSNGGIDITKAKTISDAISRERPVLQEIVNHKGEITIRAENGKLRILNLQFRSAIRECRAKLVIKNQVAVINSFG